MEKLLYPIWRPGGGDEAAFVAELTSTVAPRLDALDPAGLTIWVTDDAGAPMRMGVAPHGDPLGALVAVWLDSLDDRGPLESVLVATGLRHAGYLVTESAPIRYPRRTWRDGERSPGIAQVTLFPRRADLDESTFLGRWHGGHTQLTFEVHPYVRYLRHAVVRPLTPDAPPIDGVVCESLPSLAHLLDPNLLHRATTDEELRTNRRRVLDDIRTFLDLERLETLPMGEWILRSGPGDEPVRAADDPDAPRSP